MTEDTLKPGREGALKAQELLDQFLKKVAVVDTPYCYRWAAEQLRLQAIKHLRSLYPHFNEVFIVQIAGAIKTLESHADGLVQAPRVADGN